MPRRPSPCSNRISGTSKTKNEAIIQAVEIPGGLLFASVIGIIGAVASLPLLLLLAGVGLLAESFFVGSIAPLTVVAGCLLLLSARNAPISRNNEGLEKPGPLSTGTSPAAI